MSGDPSGRLSHATFAELIASEHAIVRGHLDHMRSIADNAQQEVPLRLRNQLDAVLSFLHNDLIAHMQGEEEVLYPALEHVAAAWSCEAMRFDHDAIIGMIDELDRLISDPRRDRWPDEIQRLLFVLEALVRLHVEKEERLFGPSAGGLDGRVEESWRKHLAGHAVQHHHAPWGFSTDPKP